MGSEPRPQGRGPAFPIEFGEEICDAGAAHLCSGRARFSAQGDLGPTLHGVAAAWLYALRPFRHSQWSQINFAILFYELQSSPHIQPKPSTDNQLREPLLCSTSNWNNLEQKNAENHCLPSPAQPLAGKPARLCSSCSTSYPNPLIPLNAQVEQSGTFHLFHFLRHSQGSVQT